MVVAEEGFEDVGLDPVADHEQGEADESPDEGAGYAEPVEEGLW